MASVTVPTAEYEDRIDRVRDELAATDADALCLFSATAIEWVSGFHHLQTERPVCLTVTHDRVGLTVPRLELDRAESDEFPLLDEVYHYYDYPGGTTEGTTYYEHSTATPEETIREMLADLDAVTVVADTNGAPSFWGYSGPSLDELADVDVETVEWIETFRESKSTVERELLRESAKWGNLAHRKLAEYVEPGKHELWVAKRASLDASMAMLDTLGERYDSRLRGGFPASCGFLSGPNTALPHGLTENRRLDRGDVIITGASANVGGYLTELERTMFVGEVSDEHRHYFEHMREMQRLAIEACGPGVPVADVDQAVHDYCHEQGLLEYTQHHTGHNIGLEGHERGFLDRGSDDVMKPGYLYTIEPALFVPDVAGYRHSDTILITEEGTESLTYYPKDLESNIIRC
ncbi:M24 family metallopeptidase [Halococcus salifodinae]|uniref:Peptidase M24 n=1 Tax=Halococcus salifodinae DSM 8989 TaxID=1227456 RepID=M0NCE2_9EURY|nr:Xaa-Pro peptidase family protein [Halococcus salifodinae]EMA55632.1 peptidase M24 [Halococcus salifodinae DSM 8989]